MEASKIDYQPVRDKSLRWALFFVYNIAIEILSDNYNKEKEKIENNHLKIPKMSFIKFVKNYIKLILQKKG